MSPVGKPLEKLGESRGCCWVILSFPQEENNGALCRAVHSSRCSSHSFLKLLCPEGPKSGRHSSRYSNKPACCNKGVSNGKRCFGINFFSVS